MRKGSLFKFFLFTCLFVVFISVIEFPNPIIVVVLFIAHESLHHSAVCLFLYHLRECYNNQYSNTNHYIMY